MSSLLLVLVNWSTFVSKLPAYQDFFTFRNIMYMWLTMGIVKVLHQFGHGLSCKRFGGEVHEMGLLFLVFTPCLYCNVTDAWMLPNKWHRAIIGAGGMYVELFLSSIFVWVWWYTEPGLLNTLSLSIIFVCSVSTVVLTRQSPASIRRLLHPGGSWIPNLRERANKYLGTVAGELFLGVDPVKDPFAPQKNRWLFVTYAMAGLSVPHHGHGDDSLLPVHVPSSLQTRCDQRDAGDGGWRGDGYLPGLSRHSHIAV